MGDRRGGPAVSARKRVAPRGVSVGVGGRWTPPAPCCVLLVRSVGVAVDKLPRGRAAASPWGHGFPSRGRCRGCPRLSLPFTLCCSLVLCPGGANRRAAVGGRLRECTVTSPGGKQAPRRECQGRARRPAPATCRVLLFLSFLFTPMRSGGAPPATPRDRGAGDHGRGGAPPPRCVSSAAGVLRSCVAHPGVSCRAHEGHALLGRGVPQHGGRSALTTRLVSAPRKTRGCSSYDHPSVGQVLGAIISSDVAGVSPASADNARREEAGSLTRNGGKDGCCHPRLCRPISADGPRPSPGHHRTQQATCPKYPYVAGHRRKRQKKRARDGRVSIVAHSSAGLSMGGGRPTVSSVERTFLRSGDQGSWRARAVSVEQAKTRCAQVMFIPQPEDIRCELADPILLEAPRQGAGGEGLRMVG